ncbi:MAG: GntR family transcriptional regulator [bacterium]|nr:GntR family transcriptional regulator [bacterium]
MILLDYRDKRPIYEQMVEKLERLIVSGVLEQGGKMPSVRSLAVELAVNPNTVQRAYTLLEQEGYLYTVTGRGSFVAPENEWRDGQRRRMLEEWTAMTRKARDAGLAQEVMAEQLALVYRRTRAEEENAQNVL